MKINKILIAGILLLAIMMMGAVSAEGNATADSSAADNINVTFDQKVYEKDMGTIDVDVPANASGNLKAKINGVEFYNENITGSVKIPITIPKSGMPILISNRDTDHTTYYLYLYFNDTEIKSNHTLMVMRVSPDYEIQAFREEILQYDDSEYMMLYFPESARGLINLYVDEEFLLNLTANHYTFLNITNFNRLPLGKHTVRIKYEGDDYYHPFDKTFPFSVEDMTIHIPKNIVLDHDDCLTAKTINNTDGKVSVFVDGVLVYKDKLDRNGEFLHSMFYNITCGEHLIEVQYNASNFSKSKKALVNVSYVVYMYAYNFVYGIDNEVNFYLPEDLDEKLINVTINGVRYPLKLENNWADLDVSNLAAGNYTIIFNYPGDSKYTPMTLEDNFTVRYEIEVDDLFRYQDCDVSIALPKEAKGNLEVYIDSKLYKSVSLVKGIAKINVNGLIPGYYNLFARYTGDDFDVDEENTTIEIIPALNYQYEMRCGDDNSIDVVATKDSKGYVLFSILDKTYKVSIKNGKASLPLKDLAVGEYYDIAIDYVGDNGYNTTLWCYLDVLPAKVNFDSVKVSSQGVKIKVYINYKLAKNTYVTFKVDKKTVKIKTDANGVANIKLGAGKHKIEASFKNAKESINVEIHYIALKFVAVKKSAKKLVLSATVKVGKKPMKYKKVTFRFNGKTYAAKTNSKGVAKVTIPKSAFKNLKVGKKITYQATCLGDTVKKTTIVIK